MKTCEKTEKRSEKGVSESPKSDEMSASTIRRCDQDPTIDGQSDETQEDVLGNQTREVESDEK